MAETVADLAVRIGADLTPLTAGLKKADTSLAEFGGKVRTGTANLAKYGAAAAAAGVAVGAALYQKTAQAVDAQAKLAAALDTSYASIATLGRAAELSGLKQEQLNQAAKKVAIGVGQLAQGAGESGAALEQLGFTADELSRLPADERIAKINQALRDNVPVSQQAALAAKIYGEDVGAAMRALDPATIAAARAETEAFGLALSDVEAAQLENANDALSSIAMVMQGALTQAAARLAPIIEGISKALAESGKEAGGFESAIDSAFEVAISGAATLANVIHGVKATFQVVADGIIAGLYNIGAKAAEVQAWLLEKLSVLPGVDYSETAASYRAFAEEANAIATAATDNIHETLMQPLPGDALRQWVDDVKVASAEAAQAQIAARQQVSAAETEAAAQLSEQDKQRIADRLERIRQGYMTETELAAQKREQDTEALIQAYEAELVTREEYNALLEETEQAHQDRLTAIKERAAKAELALEQERNRAMEQSRSTFLSNLAGLMNTSGKRAFEFGKKAAIGEALVKGGKAVMSAWEAGMSVGGPWAPAIAAGYAAAAGINAANLVNNIRKQTFGGGGGGSAPVAATQGSSGIAAPERSADDSGGTTRNTFITLQGDSVNRDGLRDLIGVLNEERDDGSIMLA